MAVQLIVHNVLVVITDATIYLIVQITLCHSDS